MNPTYVALEKLWDRYLAGEWQTFENEVLVLLAEHSIKPRADDGMLKRITISKPTEIQNSIVIGLRYTKRDETDTEDQFLCREITSTGQPEIEPYYRGRLEREVREYRGTHKEQVDLDKATGMDSTITHVNTISYLVERK